MPYKKNNRNKEDAISPDNVTGYYFAGTREKRFPIPGDGSNPLYGVTGYITTCGKTIGSGRGIWNECIDGYDEVTYIYNKEGIIDDTSKVFGDETYNTELLANRGESNYISYTAPGATQNQSGNICQQGTVDGCKCISRHDRRVCKRNIEKKPYGGDPKKCCLESDTNKLMEMDCDPKYFKTSNGLDVSIACDEYIDSICKKPPAYILNNSEVELNADYIKLCGCNYPEEYYDLMAKNIIEDLPNITEGMLGDKVCWAPTCTKADISVQPTLKNNCPDNYFMSCINSIEINNSGVLDGIIDITQTNECQQFIEESKKNVEIGGGGGGGGGGEGSGVGGTTPPPKKKEKSDESDYTWLFILILILIGLPLLIGSVYGLYIYFKKRNKNQIIQLQ